nr:Wnt7 [Nilaparvata lugens]
MPPALLCTIVVLALLHTSTNLRAMSSVVALGAGAICSRIPGLTGRQRDMCRQAPAAMVAVGDGVRLASSECQHQFRAHRWNCTNLHKANSFGHVVLVGSREAAFTYAMASAGVTWFVAAACSRGNISTCGCAGAEGSGDGTGAVAGSGSAATRWKWAGCKITAGYGMRLARRFLDAREIEGDARSLMNLHNNRAGRKLVKWSLKSECKCHGVSGSCTMKTCWQTLPAFRQVGDLLMHKYWRARSVAAVTQGGVAKGGLRLALRRAKGGFVEPRRSDLVYLHASPNYCDSNPAVGSLGTVGRSCNRTSTGTDGCDLLCCGRGYNTHQYTRTWQCNCKFHWCCYVRCETCSEKSEQYTCK